MPTLRAVDFETTDLSPTTGEICEVGWTDIVIADPETDGTSRIRCGVDSWESRVIRTKGAMNPAARAVNHITDEELSQGHNIDQVFLEVFQGADFYVAHNAKFEQSFRDFPEPVICTMKLAYVLAPDSPSFSNQCLRYYLNTGATYNAQEHPHRAGPDSWVTAHTFKHFTDRIPSTWTVEQWLQNCLNVSRNPGRLPRCPIGKERGKMWADVDMGFLIWITRQDKMEEDIKYSARQELNRRQVHT